MLYKVKKERLFTNQQLLALLWPLIIEQALGVLVGMADTVMVSSVGEAAISGVSLVDMINQLIITVFGALATGGAVVTSQHLGAKRPEEAARSAGQLVGLSGILGTAVWAKTPALSVRYGLDADVHNHEGRAITLEYPDFYLVNLYVPNAQNELARIDYRMQWEDDLRRYLQKLDAEKPVILCGDLNVAHEDIDLKNPGPNRGAAGFSDQERGKLDELLAAGFTDSFRRLHPDTTGMYSWWSMRFRARERNAGWRIDYFLVSDRIADKIQNAAILMDVMGSDHCPVELDINL